MVVHIFIYHYVQKSLQNKLIQFFLEYISNTQNHVITRQCGCFRKNLSEFLNFKFISKCTLIHLNIASLQIQNLLC
jgi:hypothetical protein